MFAQGVLAQAVKSSNNGAENTLPLVQLFEYIEAQEGISFSFVLEDLKGIQVDTTFVKTWDALQAELPSLGFRFRSENEALFLIAPAAATVPAKDASLTLQITDGQEPLVGASVQSSDGRFWVTDVNGRLVLERTELPEELTVRYVGYVTENFRDFKNGTRSISLRRDTMVTALAEIVATLPARLLKPVLSVQQAENAEAFNTLRLPPIALSSFGFMGVAGVSTLDGDRALPAIRGSQGSETLVELDGLPLYHIDHLFGLFSAINPQAVDQIDLYRSHYPADRGGFRGGLMDIHTIPNNLNSIQLDLDQLSAAATVTGTAGPIRVLASARSSLGNVAGTSTFQNTGSENDARNGITAVTTPDFSYYDLYTRIDIQPSGSKWSGTVNGYTSMDAYSFNSDSERIIDERRRPLTLDGNYLEESAWRNLGFGGSLHYRTKKLIYTLDVHRTEYEQSLNASSDFSVRNLIGSRDLVSFENELQNNVTDQQAEFSVRGGKKGDSWSAGIQAQQLQTEALFRFNEIALLDLDQSGNRLHAFATRIQPLGKHFSANLGLRATKAYDLKKSWLSPRLILSYALPSDMAHTSSKLHAGYSFIRQATRALQHENQFGQSYTVLVLDVPNRMEQPRANNFTLGFSHSTATFKLGIEGYYRTLPGIVAALSSSIGVNNDVLISAPVPTFTTVVGKGEVLGIDTDLRYEKGPFSGQAAYTLSRSIQSFKRISLGAWQRAPDDRRHRFATSHSYTKGRWSGGFNYEAASGLVYNDLNAVTEASSREALDPDTFQERLPAYHRVDLFGKFEQPFGKTPDVNLSGLRTQKSFSLGLRLYNAFDRANLTQRQYILNLETDVQRPTLTALGTDVALLGRVLLVEGAVQF